MVRIWRTFNFLSEKQAPERVVTNDKKIEALQMQAMFCRACVKECYILDPKAGKPNKGPNFFFKMDLGYVERQLVQRQVLCVKEKRRTRRLRRRVPTHWEAGYGFHSCLLTFLQSTAKGRGNWRVQHFCSYNMYAVYNKSGTQSGPFVHYRGGSFVKFNFVFSWIIHQPAVKSEKSQKQELVKY